MERSALGTGFGNLSRDCSGVWRIGMENEYEYENENDAEAGTQTEALTKEKD